MGTSWVGEVKTQDRHFPSMMSGLPSGLSERWGVAARHVRGPGDDIWGSPVESGDRIFSGEGNLRYTTVTARRRWFMASGMELQHRVRSDAGWIL